MSIDLDRAAAFVERHGTPIERARLAAIVDQRLPEAVPPELLALQNEDGGFPFDQQAGAPSTLNHTALTIQWLDDLGQVESESAMRASAFIASRQTVRGIWRESPELRRFPLPLWMDPESAAADVYTTALCASTLLPDAEALLALDRAVAWLQSQQGRDGLLHGFRLHASWLAVPVFAEMLGQEARATRRLVGALGNALSHEWTASMVAAMLLKLFDADYTQRTEVVERGWQLLQEMQAADGSFASEDEAEGSVAATLNVIAVAHRIDE